MCGVHSNFGVTSLCFNVSLGSFFAFGYFLLRAVDSGLSVAGCCFCIRFAFGHSFLNLGGGFFDVSGCLFNVVGGRSVRFSGSRFNLGGRFFDLVGDLFDVVSSLLNSPGGLTVAALTVAAPVACAQQRRYQQKHNNGGHAEMDSVSVHDVIPSILMDCVVRCGC